MIPFDQLYHTMIGVLVPEARIPGIENAFAEGEICSNAYGNMRDAYMRICARFGDREEDEDLEIIVSCMEEIQQELCYRMYMLIGCE